MTLTRDTTQTRLQSWQTADPGGPLARLLGEPPAAVHLDRVHFPGSRPVQLVYTATLRGGGKRTVLAEEVADPVAHRAAVLTSLGKSRMGQRSVLTETALVADPATGLVLRRPGFDERLPGLRLLHDPAWTRAALARLTGTDPGPVRSRLAAHRLGKRAVLRIVTRRGVLYARLRAIKSADGTDRLALHQSLWQALAATRGLRIPRPLGSLPEIGAAFFAELPGMAPDFGTRDSRAIASALATLRGLDLPDLPLHAGPDEARLLRDWLGHCSLYRPGLADRLAPPLMPVLDALDAARGDPLPCHRDLHEKQLRIGQGALGILDFDTLSRADPALDPGNLLAHLFLAGRDETALRRACALPGLGFWRRVALFRLAMIYGLTAMPEPALARLIAEASRDDRN